MAEDKNGDRMPSWVLLFASSVAAAVVAGLVLDVIRRGMADRRARMLSEAEPEEI